MAWTAAAIAYWVYRSARFASLRSMYCPTSNPFTSWAKRTLKAEASNRVIGAPPDRPSRRDCQVVATSFPTDDTHPAPVMTTRRFREAIADQPPILAFR